MAGPVIARKHPITSMSNSEPNCACLAAGAAATGSCATARAATGKPVGASAARRLAVLAMAATVAGCGLFGGDQRPLPCPNFLILGDAGELVRFTPGRGRDITDVDFEAKIVDFEGSCKYGEKSVESTFTVDIAIERGPADDDREARFEFFIAIPKFHPAPEGKRTFPVAATFEGNRARLLYRDSLVIDIPLKAGETGANYDVFIGFQLTSAELEFNRDRKRR